MPKIHNLKRDGMFYPEIGKKFIFRGKKYITVYGECNNCAFMNEINHTCNLHKVGIDCPYKGIFLEVK